MPLDDFLMLPGTVTRVPSMPQGPTQSTTDAYPRVILDIRDTTHQPFGNGEDVYRWWSEFLAAKRPSQSLYRDEDGRHVIPWISGSMWVALCPACNGGCRPWDQIPECACLDCGRVYEVDWQPPAIRAEVCRVLAVRPAGNRHWHAHEGETIQALKTENIFCLGVDPLERQALLKAEGLPIPDDIKTQADILERIAAKARK